MTYEKCCRNCEHAYLSSCKGCNTLGENKYQNFELREELAEKDVSDRALELALSEIYDLTKKYEPELIIPLEITREEFVEGTSVYKDKAKQELATVANKGNDNK